MKLSQICRELAYECLKGSMDVEVRDIVYDSRKIAKETMFVCMVGAVTDGHKLYFRCGESRRVCHCIGEGGGSGADSGFCDGT